jgi:hypothetical protein
MSFRLSITLFDCNAPAYMARGKDAGKSNLNHKVFHSGLVIDILSSGGLFQSSSEFPCQSFVYCSEIMYHLSWYERQDRTVSISSVGTSPVIWEAYNNLILA